MELKIYQKNGDHYDLGHDGTAQYDIAYSHYSDKNRLDLYLPAVKKETYPTVVFIHGGAFFKSSKGRHLSNILNSLLYGYAVASIDYRLNDEVIYPDIRQDCIDALNFLAERPEIDADKIIIWGESHGAFLACDIAVNRRKGLEFSPAGIISFYAPVDLADYYQYKEEHKEHVIVNGRENDSVSFGAEGEELQEKLKQYTILENIRGDEPPFFLLHGQNDECIPVKYTYQLDQALNEKGVKHTLDVVEEGVHGIDFYAEPKYNAPVMEFVDRVFKGEYERQE